MMKRLELTCAYVSEDALVMETAVLPLDEPYTAFWVKSEDEGEIVYLTDAQLIELRDEINSILGSRK